MSLTVRAKSSNDLPMPKVETMSWELSERLCSLPSIGTEMPIRRKLRDETAKTLQYSEILQSSTHTEDRVLQRKQRWKYIRNFFIITSKSPFSKCSFENALYAHAHFIMTVEQFVMRVMLEFKFPNNMKMDDHLSWLFRSFDHFRSNSVDWRKMLCYFKVLTYFRFVRDRPIDLLLLLFDVYADGDRTATRSVDRDKTMIRPARSSLLSIFKVPCIEESDVYGMVTLLEPLFVLAEERGDVLSRKSLETLLRRDRRFDRLVSLWSSLAWERLLTDQRLTVLDEAQERHLQAAEAVIARYQLEQALVIYKKNAQKHCFRGWKIVSVKASGARAFALTRLRRRALKMMQRWRRISRRYQLYRRKRLLAQVMGDYTIKARCFKRILLHNRLIRKLTRLTGSLHPKARQLSLAATHLHNFRRLHDLRVGLQRWATQVRTIVQYENATNHYRRHLLGMTLRPWRRIAHAHAEEVRQETVVRENQVALQKMLEEAEAAALELVRLEEEREARRKEQEAIEAERARLERLEAARLQAQKEKEREQRAILNSQASERSQRIQRELQRMRALFNVDFEFKAREILSHTKERTIAYIENPENKLAIDLKFETLKREFFANPSPETKERERMLSSYKNILFLFIDAQLKKEKVDLEDLYRRFDNNSKGYLTYGEFAQMIRSLNTRLSEAQISNVIRHVDADKDGYITLGECLACMACVEKMGVPGCAWKLYIDPIEDVICYHNFETQERFLEYEMNDKVLRGINLANIYAEAEHAAQLELKTARKEEWQAVLRNYMARRLQFMFRQWKGRQVRKRLLWRVLQREQALCTKKQRRCVEFIIRRWRGRRVRGIFARQLAFTIEKVWDHDSKRAFFFNHSTRHSSWETPRLLQMVVQKMNLGAWYKSRITEPCVWQPVAEINSSMESGCWRSTADEQSSGDMDENSQSTGLSFIHVMADRVFPGKPDGYPLCCICSSQLAVHTCLDCAAHYCFSCHRSSHGNPFGFLQNAKARRSQYTNPDFVAQLYNFQHQWESTKPLSCKLCNGREGLFAAFFCQECDAHLCRRCFARVHKHDMKPAHSYYRA